MKTHNFAIGHPRSWIRSTPESCPISFIQLIGYTCFFLMLLLHFVRLLSRLQALLEVLASLPFDALLFLRNLFRVSLCADSA